MATKLDPRGKLSMKERIGYSLGGYGMNITYSLVSAFLLVYYVSVAGADALAAANVIAVSKIFDGVSDLLMGWIVDHTHSRYGKARPWILRLCLPLAVCTVLMFSAPENASGTMLIAFSVIKGIGFGMCAAPMYGMLQDSITYGEWKDGISAFGMGNAAASFGQKIGSGLGASVLGWILAAGNFTADPTSASALTSINFAFIWVPALCTVITIVAMLFYNLDKKYDQISADLTVGKHKSDQ